MEFDYPHSSPTSSPPSQPPPTTFQHHRRGPPVSGGHAETHFTTSSTTRKVLVSLCLLCLSVLLVAVGASAEPEEQTSLSSSLCDPDGPLALGMESGAIADSALSASSAYEMLHVGPNNARLKTDNAGGAWCPQKQLDAGNSGSEWIQVDLGASHVITGVATQGRYGKGMGQEFTEAYRLLYSRANAPDRWILWRSSDNVSNLEGNLDANTVEEHHLEMAIVGVRRLRLVPLSNYTRTVCLRFELYGCPYYGPISYSTPVPSSSSSNGTTTASSVVDSRLLDTLYDGALGKLTDGVKPLPGATGAFAESPPDRQHSIWLAWPPTSVGGAKSQSTTTTSTVPLVFEFDGLSNCSTVAINALNRFSSSVRVFSLATIAFSLDGRRWSEAPIRFHYQADNVIQLPRDVLIHLQYRIGRFVRIELTYSAEWWLQLSEVAFDCRPVAAELLANLTSAQLEALFSRLNSPAYNYAADASSSSSSSSGTRYTMDHHQNSEKNSLATLLVPAPHGGSGAINWNIPWKLSLVIISLCAIGLVVISLLASFALKKLHHRKTLFSFSSSNSSNGSGASGPSLFLTSENGTVSSTVPSGVATINLKSMPADESSSPLYCEPKEFAHQQQYDPEYAIPDAVICAVGGNLSKTLHYGQLLQPNSVNYQHHLQHHQQQQHHLHQQNHHHQLLLQQQQNGSKANAISCKTLQVNQGRQQQPLQRHHPSSERRSFYASSDLLLAGKGQNIYGSRPPQQQQQQQQILNVFDIGRGVGVGLTRTLNNHHRASNYYTSGTNGGHLSNNSSSNPTAATTTTASSFSSTLGLRVYSEAEVGVLQSLGKCKFGDVLLCNVPGSASTKGLRRLAVVRTVNDLNLKAEFVAAMSWARTRSLACDRFARLFGVIETPTYYASLTEAGDCDLHYYLRKTDYLSYETLLYIAGEIAAAGAYLEAASLPAVNGGSAQQQLQQQQEQTHRDIAARNVIIYESTLTVKLTDVAAYEEQWAADYVDGLPIRWMAPASVAGRGPLFSLPGDVYAFGVTLWEVMTGCKVRPFAEYGDEELVAAMYAYLDAKEEEEKGSDDEGDNEDNDTAEAPRLPVPTHCTPEIASLIEECTAAEEHQRPTFKEICLFLQRKTAAAGSGKPH